MRCNFKEYCKTQIEPFIVNREEEKLYDYFGAYLLEESSTFDNSKGMFIRGVVGSGKTIMFKMAQRFKGKRCKIKFINTEKLAALFEDGQKIDKYLVDEWIFDDLGTEQKANNYGKGVEIFKRVIEDRYDIWKFNGVRTHFTSNCSNEILEERYGERAYDRLKEMCNVVKYPSSESKRGKSTIRPLNEINEMPEKSQEQKDAELKSVMEEIFQEMNNYYKQGMTSFTFNNGIKFYGCLKYFGIMPDYKSPELWERAKQSILLSYMNNADRESRPLIAYIKDSKAPLSDDLKSRVKVSITNTYKGLLVSKYFNDSREFFDDLSECRD